MTKAHVGLGSVDNESKATMFASPTFTGTVAGVTKGHVGLSSVTNDVQVKSDGSNAPAILKNSEISLTATGGTVTLNNANATNKTIQKADIGLGSVDNTADSAKPISTAQATVNTAQGVTNALKAPLASPTFTGTVAGVTKAHVGLTNVIDQAITVADGALKFGSTVQTLDEDTVSNSAALGGSTLAQTKAAAVSTAETNIVGSSPGLLDTLTKIKTALNNDTSFNSTITASIATKGKAAMAITANDAANSNYDNDPTSESEGQVGIYNGQQYVVVDVS